MFIYIFKTCVPNIYIGLISMYLSQIDLIKPRPKFYHIASPSNGLNMMADRTTAIFLICLPFAYFLSANHE